MASNARQLKRLRRVAPWLLFAVAGAVSALGLWLQVQVNGGMAHPAWVPVVAGLSTVVLFARIAACIALCGVLLLALHPARNPGKGQGKGGGLPAVPRRKLALPSLRRDAADPGAQARPAASDPLARLAPQSAVVATVRQRQVARRARDIIAARQARGAEPA